MQQLSNSVVQQERSRQERFDVNKLKDRIVRSEFTITLRNGFDVLTNLGSEDDKGSVDDKWGGSFSTYTHKLVKSVSDIDKNRGSRIG